MLSIPATAAPVNSVLRSVLDGRTTEHPPRPCRRVLAYFWGVTQTLPSAGCTPIMDLTPGLNPRCIWRDARQGGWAPGTRGGSGWWDAAGPAPSFHIWLRYEARCDTEGWDTEEQTRLDREQHLTEKLGQNPALLILTAAWGLIQILPGNTSLGDKSQESPEAVGGEVLCPTSLSVE